MAKRCSGFDGFCSLARRAWVKALTGSTKLIGRGGGRAWRVGKIDSFLFFGEVWNGVMPGIVGRCPPAGEESRGSPPAPIREALSSEPENSDVRESSDS